MKKVRVRLLALYVTAVCLVNVPLSAFPQGRLVTMTVGGTLGVVKPAEVRQGPGVAGGALGVEIGREALRLRITSTFAKSFLGGDDVSICWIRLDRPGECYTPAYARTYRLHAGDVLLQPSFLGPVYVLGGGGAATSTGRTRPSTDPIARQRYLWRAGGGITLGRSVRAPRLEMVRTEFDGAMGVARHLVTVQLWLR